MVQFSNDFHALHIERQEMIIVTIQWILHSLITTENYEKNLEKIISK